MKKIAINLASQLRLKDISTDVDLLGKSLKKQMEIASNSKYVIIVAPKEYTDNSVIIRNMRDGSEKQVKIDVMLNDLKSSLQL
jgi:histidyl-tRNA synthetase